MIHYIVAVYVGERKNAHVNQYTTDPRYAIDLHIESLSKLVVPEIKRVSFVVSPSFSMENDTAAVEHALLNSGSLSGVEIDSFIGDNNNDHSYGSWNFAMKKHISGEMDFFLIEDDYFPCHNEFYLPFIEKMGDNTAYISQLYVGEGKRTKSHAAISNGLMAWHAAKRHYDKFRECIFTRPLDTKTVDAGVYAQTCFLKNYDRLKYEMGDVSDSYCHPFLERNNSISLYGNTEGKILISPLFYDDSQRSSYRIKTIK